MVAPEQEEGEDGSCRRVKDHCQPRRRLPAAAPCGQCGGCRWWNLVSLIARCDSSREGTDCTHDTAGSSADAVRGPSTDSTPATHAPSCGYRAKNDRTPANIACQMNPPSAMRATRGQGRQGARQHAAAKRPVVADNAPSSRNHGQLGQGHGPGSCSRRRRRLRRSCRRAQPDKPPRWRCRPPHRRHRSLQRPQRRCSRRRRRRVRASEGAGSRV